MQTHQNHNLLLKTRNYFIMLVSLLLLIGFTFAGDRGRKHKKHHSRHHRHQVHHEHYDTDFDFGFYWTSDRPSSCCSMGGHGQRGCGKPTRVWIDGYWDWRGGEYFWIDGYWTQRPPGAHWLPGHWTLRRGYRIWVSPRWSNR